MIKNRDEIIHLSSFKNIFEILNKQDPKVAENIEVALKKSVEKTHLTLASYISTTEQCKIALLEEIIVIKDHTGIHSVYLERISQKRQHLLEFASETNEILFDSIFDNIIDFFDEKKEKMYADLEREFKWNTNIIDVTKKGAPVLNKSIELINKASENLLTSKIIKDNIALDDTTLLEKIAKKHLNPKDVADCIAGIITNCMEEYTKNWEREVSALASEITSISSRIFSEGNERGYSTSFELGYTEQTLLVGLSSAVAGTIGLAVGWHTLAYSIMNVFPPIALFTLAATVLTGILTKDNALKQKKDQIDKIIEQYCKHFLMSIETTPIADLNKMTLRKYIIQKSNEMINLVIDKIWDIYYGNLNKECLCILDSAYTKHCMLIQEALDDINKIQCIQK